MTLAETLEMLESHGNASVRSSNAQYGAPDNQFGVRKGDLRTIAKKIKTDHDLGLQLWQTGNTDAMLLATLVLRPNRLSEEEIEAMVSSATFTHLADWLMTHIVKEYPNKEKLRLRWMSTTHPMLGRAAWSLTTERILKQPEGINISELLDRIEREMSEAPPPAQWTMNYCLAEIGITFVEYRQRAIDIGERLGIYRDFPVSKGCTSPFAPIWIQAMVSRQE